MRFTDALYFGDPHWISSSVERRSRHGRRLRSQAKAHCRPSWRSSEAYHRGLSFQRDYVITTCGFDRVCPGITNSGSQNFADWLLATHDLAAVLTVERKAWTHLARRLPSFSAAAVGVRCSRRLGLFGSRRERLSHIDGPFFFLRTHVFEF